MRITQAMISVSVELDLQNTKLARYYGIPQTLMPATESIPLGSLTLIMTEKEMRLCL